MTTALNAMAQGDLTHEPRVHTRDEIRDMANSLRTAQLRLRDLVQGVALISTSVAAASEELTTVSAQVGAHTDTTAAQLDRAAASAEDVSTNIQTVAAGTEEMTASIREIGKSANDAAGVAAQAVHVADATNSTVAKLGTSSAEIGDVVKAITSIAEQTNLLALNATIEAAVAAITKIAGIIGLINDTQATIVSAVEEQTTTTNKMARNVHQAPGGAQQIAGSIRDAAQVSELNVLVGRFTY